MTNSASGREIEVQDKLSRSALGTVSAIEIGSHSYIHIEQFARLLAIPTERNAAAKSITLHYKDNAITFTAYNPFIRFNKLFYQMPAEVRFPNGEFYAPLAGLLDGLNGSGINTVEYEASARVLRVYTRPANIVRISTASASDTVKLVLHTTQPFQDSEVTTIEDGEWIYLTINGGVVDSRENLGFSQIPEVFELVALQVNKDQARLALHTAPNIMLDQVKCNPAASEIVVALKPAAVATSAIFADLQKEREKWKIDTIVIDPGHGGRDPGCNSPGKIYEKNISLAIAKALRAEIERRLDVNIIMTRESDVFIPLQGRTKKANDAGGKLFISIHVDANRVKSLRGHTIYFLGPAKTDDAREVAQFENSVIKFEESQKEYAGLSDASFILAANAQNSYNKESQDFASMVDEEIKKQCGSKSHGVRQAGFYVLYGASMPNILVETGFMTNSADRDNLNSRAYQQSLATAVTNGIIKFKERYESLTF